MEVVIIDSGYKSYDFEKQLFEKNGIGLKVFPSYDGLKQDKMEFARDADGILVRHTRIDEEFLNGMKNLRAVVRYGVGYDNVDVEACSLHNIKVSNVQGYANHSVSDHALALMFTCSRALWNTKEQLLQNFGSPSSPDIFELHDKTLGIIGLGRIGSEFCRKASPLFRKVYAADPYKPDNHFKNMGATRTSLDELLSESHVISIHCNLTPETRHLLNAGKFNLMKNRPVIINTSRGEVINEADLLDALDSGLIHSAGLDVYENEPVSAQNVKLLNHPRMICTGHYAWYSDMAAEELQRRAAVNMLNFLQGNPVGDCLNCPD
ncbi:MAG: C-terminal binding protein [Methanosarcina sp.]